MNAELVADAIRTVAKAEAMYYVANAANAASRFAVGDSRLIVLDALNAKREEARAVLVRVLESMGLPKVTP